MCVIPEPIRKRVGFQICLTFKGEEMAFELPQLPYAKNALEPHISAQTFDFHHGKHHNAYVVKTNELLAGTALEGKSLEAVIQSAKDSGDNGLFNQSRQVVRSPRRSTPPLAPTRSLPSNSRPPVPGVSVAVGFGWLLKAIALRSLHP